MQPFRLHKAGWHHFYFGVLLMLIAFFLIFTQAALWIVLILGGLGFVIAFDDFIQHIIHRRNPAYRSPLHRLGGWFLKRIKAARTLLRVLDWIFGKN